MDTPTPEVESTERTSVEVAEDNDPRYNPNDVLRCHLCYPDDVEVAMFSKTLAILHGPDGWFLLAPQGHSGDVVTTLGKDRPVPDPDPTLGNAETPEDEAIEDAFYETPEGLAQLKAGSKWIDVATAAVVFTPTTHPETYWWLIQDMIEEGYDPDRDGVFAFWVYNRAGKVLEFLEDPDDKFPASLREIHVLPEQLDLPD
jgi:hypothetical protein